MLGNGPESREIEGVDMTHPLSSTYTKRYRERARREAFAAYGDRCACCGEANPAFLTIDHIGNNGKQHRLSREGRTINIYAWARRHGYPLTLQLLCANCNFGRAWHDGICPHTTLPDCLRPLAVNHGFLPPTHVLPHEWARMVPWEEPQEWQFS